MSEETLKHLMIGAPRLAVIFRVMGTVSDDLRAALSNKLRHTEIGSSIWWQIQPDEDEDQSEDETR